MNLVTNAIKFTLEGSIKLKARITTIEEQPIPNSHVVSEDFYNGDGS
jgi:signal transduction histidine kinase